MSKAPVWTMTAGFARPLHKGSTVYKTRIVRKELRSGRIVTDHSVCTAERLSALGFVKQGKRFVYPTLPAIA